MQNNCNIFVIIQARMTSSRLPKKVLLPLCGSTVLEVVINRLKHYKRNVIVATTNDGTEEPIVALCKRNNIKYFQGSTNNVLERYYFSAKNYNAKENDIIVRVTSDCPLIDSGLIDKCINMFHLGHYDYVSNRINRTIPLGLDVEVFNFKLLKYTYENATEDFEKEHVTPYIYLTKNEYFNIGSCEEEVDNSQYRLTLDELSDYKAIMEVYKKLKNKIDFNYEELLEVLEQNSYIKEINCFVSQKQLN